MKSKRIVALLLLLIVWLLAAAPQAAACTCGPVGTPCEAYGTASSVFIGLVTNVTISNHEGYRSGVYEIRVEEVFAGKLGPTVRVESSDLLCGYEFELDKRYLIYTYGDRKDTDSFFVTYCSRTRPLEEATEDLQFLRSRRAGSDGVRIYGTVVRGDLVDSSRTGSPERPPAAGIRLRVEGEGRSYDVVADVTGVYEVVGTGPGDYLIEVILPDGFVTRRQDTQRVFLNDGGCASLRIYVYRRDER